MDISQLITDGFHLLICEFTERFFLSSMILFLDNYIYGSGNRMLLVTSAPSSNNNSGTMAEIENNIIKPYNTGKCKFIAIKFKTAQQ